MKFTKNILLVVFVLALTIPKGFWHFAVHTPAFIEHFHHHNQEHSPVSVFEFIAEHTTDTHSHNHEKGNHNHDNLPFHHHHHSTDNSQTLIFFPFTNKENIKTCLLAPLAVKITSRQFFHSSEFPQSIWQPPKFG